jgi:hypothetical protein
MITKTLLLNEIAEQVSINQSQFDNVKASYEAVGMWLSGDDVLARLNCRIFPQGSIAYGTAIKPFEKEDEYDIDMVCLVDDNSLSAQEIKQRIGNRLKQSAKYARMLDPEGKRCWTLQYSDSLRYHMDILPTKIDPAGIVYDGKRSILATNKDKESQLYTFISTNPEGYIRWFESIIKTRRLTLREAEIQPIIDHPFKTPMQKCVQLLKRHRDAYFAKRSSADNDDKPISMIITTLSAQAYRGEQDIQRALSDMVFCIEAGITIVNGRYYIGNPTDPKENFADKWTSKPNKYKMFSEWISQLKKDVLLLEKLTDMNSIATQLKTWFGESTVTKAFNAIGDSAYGKRENSEMKMDPKSGILNTEKGETVAKHTFYGKKQ